jgi:hypothetical protein
VFFRLEATLFGVTLVSGFQAIQKGPVKSLPVCLGVLHTDERRKVRPQADD